MNYQTGILAAIPPVARYLTFQAKHQADIRPVITQLLNLADGESVVIGFGKALLLSLIHI